MTPKQETKNSRKVLQEVMTIMEKQDLRQNLYGFKKENTQTLDRQNKENSKQTQNKPKNRNVNCKKLKSS